MEVSLNLTALQRWYRSWHQPGPTQHDRGAAGAHHVHAALLQAAGSRWPTPAP